MMVDLAAGECGLIIPGYVYPAGTGKSAPCQAGMEYPCHAEAWRDAIDKIHAHGSKVVFQVGDGGVRYVPGLSKAFDFAGISPVLPGTREMTNLELEELVHAFIKSARMLKAVGADGVQVHGAHGYLVSAALSPVMNKRTDKWGGSFGNRLRLAYEIARGIRAETGDDFVIGIKINGDDCAEGGVKPELCGQYLRCLPMLNFAEISGGLVGVKSWGIRSRAREELIRKVVPKDKQEEVLEKAKMTATPYTEGYNLNSARIVHKVCPSMPLAVVGGNRNFAAMEAMVTEGTASIISMSRPFLKQPSLVKDLREGRIQEVACDSCGLCTLYRDKGVMCHNW